MAKSAVGKWCMNVYADQVYAPDRKTQNSLDVYAPKSGEMHPVVIFIHGGSFNSGDKRSSVFYKPIAFTAKGFVFVSVDYRLSPKVKYPAHVRDVAKSIAWVRRNIIRYGGNPNRIYVMGHSAGAQLAALVSVDSKFLAAEGLKLSALSGTVLLDGGTYNLVSTARFSQRHDMLLEAFGKSPQVWWHASPINNIRKKCGISPCLILCVAGRADGLAQAIAFKNRLRSADVRAEVKTVVDRNHATLNEKLGAPNDRATNDVFAFLSRY